MTTTPTSLPADFAAVVARVVADAECLTRMAAGGVWSQVSLASAADLSVALLRDLDRLLAEETGLPVLVAEEPLTCVVRGCGMALERMERLGTIFTSE